MKEPVLFFSEMENVTTTRTYVNVVKYEREEERRNNHDTSSGG